MVGRRDGAQKFVGPSRAVSNSRGRKRIDRMRQCDRVFIHHRVSGVLNQQEMSIGQ